MKKSLSSFAENFTPQQKNPQINSDTSSPPPDLEATVKELYSKPREELWSTLQSEVAKQKALGTFDAKKIENTLNTLDAFLSPEQKKNIKELLNQIS